MTSRVTDLDWKVLKSRKMPDYLLVQVQDLDWPPTGWRLNILVGDRPEASDVAFLVGAAPTLLKACKRALLASKDPDTKEYLEDAINKAQGIGVEIKTMEH